MATEPNGAREGLLRSARELFRASADSGNERAGKRPRVGLALAGGFARVISHIGVLLQNASIGSS